jgi:hypothetical protein
MPIFLTIFDALDFHYIFGTALKGARLDYMKNYWASRAKNIPNVQINTPLGNFVKCAAF